MARTTSGLIPYSCAPISASPESFSSTRRGAGLPRGDGRVGHRQAASPVASRRGLADRHAREARHPDVLAQQGDLLGNQVADLAVGVAVRLLEQADRLEPLVQLALHNHRDAVGRPAVALRVDGEQPLLSSRRAAGTSSRLTYSGAIPATCMAISRASCWKSSVRATKSVSQFSSTARRGATVVDVARHDPSRPRGRPSWRPSRAPSRGAERGLLVVAAGLLERALAVHDSGAGFLPEPLHLLGLDHLCVRHVPFRLLPRGAA